MARRTTCTCTYRMTNTILCRDPFCKHPQRSAKLKKIPASHFACTRDILYSGRCRPSRSLLHSHRLLTLHLTHQLPALHLSHDYGFAQLLHSRPISKLSSSISNLVSFSLTSLHVTPDPLHLDKYRFATASEDELNIT
jgi:hypothetical protein